MFKNVTIGVTTLKIGHKFGLKTTFDSCDHSHILFVRIDRFRKYIFCLDKGKTDLVFIVVCQASKSFFSTLCHDFRFTFDDDLLTKSNLRYDKVSQRLVNSCNFSFIFIVLRNSFIWKIRKHIDQRWNIHGKIFSSSGRRLVFKRSWVRILAPDIRWIFSH